jgi:hypothetical protein
MNATRAAVLGCFVLAGCAALSPHGSTPIATWEGKHPVGETVDCVTRALDYNYRSVRPLLPSVTHKAKEIEAGRVFEVGPDLPLGTPGTYFVRVQSEDPGKSKIELFIPVTQYDAPLRDLLAKCAS